MTRKKPARPDGLAKGDDASTAFPASEKTPGQRESRDAYAELLKRKTKPKWWQDYLEIRAEHGLDWRKAVWVAWESQPATGRYPKTLEELATHFMGLRSSRVIRKWRQNNPELDNLIAKLQAAPLLKHRRDVIDALIAVAKRKNPESHRDRKLFLEMTGDYKPRRAMELMGEDGGPIEIMDLEAEYQKDMTEVIDKLNRGNDHGNGSLPPGKPLGAGWRAAQGGDAEAGDADKD